MDRFYATAFEVLVARDAFVDKFVGDEVIGTFIPVMTDGLHAREAIEAGRELLARPGTGSVSPGSRSGSASTPASRTSARSGPMSTSSSPRSATPST